MNVNPYVEPTVPLLSVNVGPVDRWCTVGWSWQPPRGRLLGRFRGLPGQRLLSLQVADAGDRKEPLVAAGDLARRARERIPAAATQSCRGHVRAAGHVIPADIAGAGGTSYINATYTNRRRLRFAVQSGELGLAAPASDQHGCQPRQAGLHDRLARSVVVGRAKAFGCVGTAYAQVPYGPPGFPYGPPGFHTAQPTPGSGPGYRSLAGLSVRRSRARPICRRPDLASARATGVGSRPRRSAVASGGEEGGGRTATTGRSSARKLPAGLRRAELQPSRSGLVVDNVIALLLFGGIAMALEGSSDSSGTAPRAHRDDRGADRGLVQAVYFVANLVDLARLGSARRLLACRWARSRPGHRLSRPTHSFGWALLQGHWRFTWRSLTC